MLVTSLTLGLLPGAAGAASVYTAQSSGRGLQLAIGGAGVGDDLLAPRIADTDRLPTLSGDGIADCIAATNPTNCETGPEVGSIIGLPLLANILSAGVISQDAFVNDVGSSKACAGLVGAGGEVSVDETPQGCVVANPTAPGGVVVNLADGLPLNLFRIRADAITSECSATGGDPEAMPPVPASASGTSHLVNVVIDAIVTLPVIGDVFVPILTLPGTSAPNSQVLFPAGPFEPLNDLVSLTLNEQTTANGGSRINVTALHLTVLGVAPGGLLDVKIGQTSCGTNTAVAQVTTTSSSSSSSSTTAGPTTSSSSTTSTTAGPTTSSSSTTSTTAEATTTTAEPTTTSSSTSSTVADTSSTSSTLLDPAASSTTSTTTARAPLAKSGVNTRAQVSLALGLLGLGMVVTGRGMQLGFDGPDRRRRP